MCPCRQKSADSPPIAIHLHDADAQSVRRGPVPRGKREDWPLAIVLLLAISSHSGCAAIGAKSPPTSELMSPERLQHGYTVVLAGVSGDADSDNKIVHGLMDGDVPTAIDIHDWTRGPFMPLHNLRDLKRNRLRAREVAGKIVEYQRRYPGRPVHLMGYSAGAGMAVLSLEALPPNHEVTNAILLAPILAPGYDLRLALSRTRNGIHSFYSRFDLPVLVGLSTLLGTMDGRHTMAAGAVGFHPPDGLSPSEAEYYDAALTQHHFSLDMLPLGNFGGHSGWTSLAFARERLAPLLIPQPGPEGRQWANREHRHAPVRPTATNDAYGYPPHGQPMHQNRLAASRSPIPGGSSPHGNRPQYPETGFPSLQHSTRITHDGPEHRHHHGRRYE